MNAHLLNRLLDMHVWNNAYTVMATLGIAGGLAVGVWRKVVIPMRKAIRTITQIGVQILGDDDPDHPVTPLSERIDEMQAAVAEHGTKLDSLDARLGEHLDHHSMFDRKPNGPRSAPARRGEVG